MNQSMVLQHARIKHNIKLMAKRQYTLSTVVCTDLRTLKAILYNYIIMHHTVTIEGKAENTFTPDNMLFHRFIQVMSITALRDRFLRITTVLVMTVAT